jgi:Uma2 family endonuclease
MVAISLDLKKEILERLKTEALVRIPASEADFFAIATELPFKVEYNKSEIITMGLASFWHEMLVTNIIFILKMLYLKDKSLSILGSNAGVQIQKFEGGYLMPDVMVVKGEPIFKSNSTAIITNPYIVVEVLSPATANYDLSEKLAEYKQIDTLQQIIFIDQKKMSVSTYSRSENKKIWLNQDFNEETESILIDNQSVTMKDIYEKIRFED